METPIASYRLGVLGYGIGMAFSLLGHVPTGLAFLSAAGLLAGALFSYVISRS